MIKIHDYKSVKNCSKCGKEMLYSEPESLKGQRSVKSITYIAPTALTSELTGVEEHLEICCSGCGFTHKEKCKDA